MSEQLDRLQQGLGLLGTGQMHEVGILPFMLLLACSVLSAFLVSFLYTRFSASRATGSDVHRAFPLLGLAVCAIFICIQFSLPLSLGLLGALSIVRFRTPIKEPEEIGYLMVVIASSLACATANLGFLAGILAVALVTLLVKQAASRLFGARSDDAVILLSLAEEDYRQKRDEVARIIEGNLNGARLHSVSRTDAGVTITYGFRGIDDKKLPEVEERLSQVAKPQSWSVLYRSSGAL